MYGLVIMTNTSHQKKESILRTLAVLGLVALILLIAWLSVQIVRVAPTAFSSLASLAEGLQSYDTETNEIVTEPTMVPLVVAAPDGDVETDQPITIAWDRQENATYSFSYECTEETSVSLLTEEGLKELVCNERYDLGTADSAELVIVSDLESTSLTYNVTEFMTGADESLQTTSNTFAVVNRSLLAAVAGESTTATSTEEAVETEPEAETADEPVSPSEPETTFTFAVPVSDPNGFVDLSTRFISVGDDDGITDTLERNAGGILFFEVHNIGTKTSDRWRFTVELPGGGIYRSDSQLPLKPNEKATLALTVETDNDSNHNFEVEIDTDEDRVSSNNSFTERVRLTN